MTDPQWMRKQKPVRWSQIIVCRVEEPDPGVRVPVRESIGYYTTRVIADKEARTRGLGRYLTPMEAEADKEAVGYTIKEHKMMLEPGSNNKARPLGEIIIASDPPR